MNKLQRDVEGLGLGGGNGEQKMSAEEFDAMRDACRTWQVNEVDNQSVLSAWQRAIEWWKDYTFTAPTPLQASAGPEGEWVSVKDMLPEKGRAVWLRDDIKDGNPHVFINQNPGERWFQKMENGSLWSVTHWKYANVPSPQLQSQQPKASASAPSVGISDEDLIIGFEKWRWAKYRTPPYEKVRDQNEQEVAEYLATLPKGEVEPCPNCKGQGIFSGQNPGGDWLDKCKYCNGSGVSQQKEEVEQKEERPKMPGKTELYGLISDYSKIDEMFVHPLLKNWVVGFLDWFFKQHPSGKPDHEQK